MFTVREQEASASQEVYEYGFSCTDTEYTNEWLHRIARHKRQTTQVLFRRTATEGGVKMAFGGRLRGENQAIASLTRPNSLFLSAAAQNNHPQLGAIHRQFLEGWQLAQVALIESEFAKRFDGFEYKGRIPRNDAPSRPRDSGHRARRLQHTRRLNRRSSREFQRAYANLTGTTDDADRLVLSLKRFRFKHAGTAGTRSLDYDLESRGTQRLAALAIPMLNAISVGQLVAVDELDASLHHRLTEALIQLFKSERNQHSAQLIATLHDTALLHDELDLDEVWLAEKDSSGASTFTPLTDFRIRSREDLERVYRDGRVGGGTGDRRSRRGPQRLGAQWPVRESPPAAERQSP